MPTKHRPLHLELMSEDCIDAFAVLHNILINAHHVKEPTTKQNLKPFDLQAALAGAKVVLRSGVTATVAAYNPDATHKQQLLGWDDNNNMRSWDTNGACSYNTSLSIAGMAPTKHTRTGWVNVYPTEDDAMRHYDTMHNTQKEADRYAANDRIACIEVTYEWED